MATPASPAGSQQPPPAAPKKVDLDALATLYSRDTRVWVTDEIEGWRGAVVQSQSRSGDSLTVVVADEHSKSLTFTASIAQLQAAKEGTALLPPLRNPPMLEGIEDLTSLSHLHEPAVLHNLRTRYGQHNIYTYSGIVLIAMNPFQRLPHLYTPDIVQAYSGKRRGELEPHLFAVAEDAFRGMIREKRNQSIIVSGESGAGKTVSAKYIMRYFATADASEVGPGGNIISSTTQLSPTTTDPAAMLQQMPMPSPTDNPAGMSEVEQQVLATNPIMESFGNAKTTRNDNSSRFGKYIELLFDERASIVGARIRTYLLERSRVVYQPETERNYHIFYQLCAGAPAAERKELGLQSHSSFHYLRQGGGNGIVPGVDDAAEFEVTQRALSTIGISVSVQWQIFRLLAAILHIGNVQITNLRSDEAYVAEDEANLAQAAKLLGLESSTFKKWLVKKQITTRSEKIITALNASQAMIIRDSVAKFLYAGLFEWLVDKINDSLCPEHIASSFKSFIGVLDIYGFEHFKKNSFEQFCINYANEKLQQEFNQHVFKLEQEEYVKEKISWSFIDFNDNQPCIQLIEGKLGILALLDEESRLPSGSDKSLTDKLYSNFDKKHKYFSKPRFGANAFIVHHFAHDVQYDSEGFIEKNKDTVPDELLELFTSESKFEFLPVVINAHKIAKPASAAASTSPAVGARKIVKQTLGSVFKQSLVQLMDTINSTNVSYIRCIKANSEKKAFVFESQMVLAQLRACGVLETIRISTAGYPGRWGFAEFVDRYYLLLKSSAWYGGIKDVRGLCTQLLEHAIPDRDKYQVGQTKIFFRAGQLAYLEKLRQERLHTCVVLIQKYIKGRNARAHYIKLRRATILLQARVRGIRARKLARNVRETRAALQIQRVFRGYLARVRYAETRVAIRRIQLAWRRHVAQKKLGNLRKEHAAVRIQSCWRMHAERKRYLAHRRKIVLAQSCMRRYFARKELKQLKVEARSVTHFKEISYRLENKVVELTQTLDTKEKEAKSLAEQVKQLENLTRTWRDKHDALLAQQKNLQDKVADSSSTSREVESLNSQIKGLTSQLNAANDIIKSKDAELASTQEQVFKLREDAARRTRAPSSAVATPVQANPQESLILESTQVNALKQEIENLKRQLAEEHERAERAIARNRAPSVDTVPSDVLWRQVAPLNEAAGAVGSIAAPSVAGSRRTAHIVGPVSTGSSDTSELRRMRRYSSVEIWTPEQKAQIEVQAGALQSNGRFTPPRTVEEAMMEQEHTFSLLRDPGLETEILDGLVRKLEIPVHAREDVSRRQVVFPAHVIGLYAIKCWQHGMNANLQTFLKNATQAIEERITYSNYDDEMVAFWISNLFELDSILKSSAAGNAQTQNRRTSFVMEGERILHTAREELEELFTSVFMTWLRLIKKRVSKFVVPCVIENQSLPGFVSKDSSSLFKKLVSQQTYTIEQLLDCVSQLWKVLKYYYLEDSVIRPFISEVFKMIGVTAFNHLLMRKGFATWKRGMQIQYNVSRLTEWCTQHSLTEASLHLERLMQAAKLLQLNKATPTNIELYIEDLFDVCFLLSPTQISRLMSLYTVADFENPISPDILRAVASRSVVSADASEVLLLEATSDTDTSWFKRPEARKVLGIEKYLPDELDMELPRIVLLFKFA